MFTREITDAFFEEALRVEALIPLTLSCHDYEALPDVFEEEFFAGFIEGSDPSEAWMQDLLSQIPGFAEFMGDETFESADAAAIAEWLFDNNFDGLLARVATPRRKYREKFCTYGWGCYQTTWIYGETLDQVAERALAWVNSKIAEWKAEGEAA